MTAPADVGPGQPLPAVRADADVPALWRALGLPGLVDVHTHFLPERLLTAIWAYFAAGGPLLGRPWPVHYRLDEQQRVVQLRDLGVRAFPALCYPHQPGLAEGLNRWSLDFAARTPGCLPSATFFPEPGAPAYVADALARGARIWKAHVQVGGYDPRDPLLDPVWGQLAQARAPVVVHCGSAPVPTAWTGPGPIGEVLRRHPGLVLVVAHLGAGEYADFLDLAAAYDDVYLDTTMCFTGFFTELAPFPAELVPRLGELRGKVLLGSDYPNIPHPYADQVAALVRLGRNEGLGEDWLRAVLWGNGARLFGVPETEPAPGAGPGKP